MFFFILSQATNFLLPTKLCIRPSQELHQLLPTPLPREPLLQYLQQQQQLKRRPDYKTQPSNSLASFSLPNILNRQKILLNNHHPHFPHPLDRHHRLEEVEERQLRHHICQYPECQKRQTTTLTQQLREGSSCSSSDSNNLLKKTYPQDERAVQDELLRQRG